ncbi:helix-turn-helix domain-containing protein [Weissella tructae]|uniref:helix-turn-helix domain-containing protein n=1 Tax=Weissella tructae TaxID=887702 RepID=UPI003D8FCF12
MTALEMASQDVKVKFKIAILQSGFKQRELAEMVGTTPAQVSRAIAGNTTPKDIEIQKKLAKILNVEL